jgi:hypothetical protein
MITQAQIDKAIASLDAEIESLGAPTEFTLRSGEVFTLKTLTSNRPDENITEGLTQQGFDIKFMAQRWAVAAPPNRRPEKGDQILREGRRHRIEYIYLQTGGIREVGYICRVIG